MLLRQPSKRLFTLAIVSLPLSYMFAACHGKDWAVLDQLDIALARQDIASILKAVEEQNRTLGGKAGVPEVDDRYLEIPTKETPYTAKEAKVGFSPWFKELEEKSWWKIGLDPTKLDHALREPAAIISGNVAVCRAKLDGSDHSLEIAKQAADFLIWAQRQAGTGLYPFPAARGVKRDNAFIASERFLARAERQGRLAEVVKNGWAIADDGNGGLQFDNGECGVAMLELYELTHERKYLDSARKAADWCIKRPVVRNWNYNSFSVYFLARAYREIGDAKYLAAAVKKTELGILPGQLVSGPNVGRWNDPHNARPSYHYIMLRALAELVAVLPQSHPSHKTITESLRLGLKNRNKEVTQRGAANKDKAIETLMIVQRAFRNDSTFRRETHSDQALEALVKLVSQQARQGKAPLGPSEWGHFLEFVSSTTA
jgi:hypothetical protein